MHRPRSITCVRRLQLAALLLFLKYLLIPVAVGLLIHSWMSEDHTMAMIGAGVMGGIPVLVATQWIVASRARCPLCMTPVLARKECTKHRRSTMLFGSHRLRVALAILCKNQFRCPYCNESTRMEVRHVKHPSPAPSPQSLRQDLLSRDGDEW